MPAIFTLRHLRPILIQTDQGEARLIASWHQLALMCAICAKKGAFGAEFARHVLGEVVVAGMRASGAMWNASARPCGQ